MGEIEFSQCVSAMRWLVRVRRRSYCREKIWLIPCVFFLLASDAVFFLGKTKVRMFIFATNVPRGTRCEDILVRSIVC